MAAVDATRRPFPTGAVVVVLAVCGTVVSLQQTLVIPLLPDFPELFGTSPDNASWLVTITLLTAAVATPLVTRLADMFGKRLMMILTLVAVVAGSVTAALGTGLAMVIVGRGLQGFGTALIPVGISIMRDELPREKVGAAVALMSATLGIGGAIGLPLAGVIYEALSWHALFWVSAGFAAVMLAAVVAIVPESKVRAGGRFDYPGAVLLSVALSALLLAITKGGLWGWTSERTVGLLLLAAVVLALWVPMELRVGQPLVDLRTSSRRPVLLTNISSLLLGFAMFANMLSTTQQLQLPEGTGFGLGMSVVGAGVAMLPGGLSMVLLAPVSAGMIRRWGARRTLLAGALTMAFGYLGRIFLTDSLGQIVVGSTVVAAGTAVGYAAMPTLIMRIVPITETASANGLNTLLRGIGTSTSSAAVTALLAASTASVGGALLPTLAAFRSIFWVAMAASLLGALAAAYLPRRGTVPVVAEEAGLAVAAPPEREELRAAGAGEEIVVRGVVQRDDGRPIRHAVVSVLRTDGEHADWSRADNDGAYSVVLPGPGRYVVVASADGWAPRSQVLDVTDATTGWALRLTERLEVSGTVSCRGRALPGALVSLTRHTGESVAAVQCDDAGRYRIPLPQTGRYVLTVLDPGARQVTSRALLVASTSSRQDVDLGPLPEEVARDPGDVT